jgi:hypothetical protein
VKYLAVTALDDRGIPGLAAMSPSGEFVARINATQTGQPSAADSLYFVVTSEFDIDLVPKDASAARELPQRFVQWIIDCFADGLMREPNDLVVNTAAMSRIDPASGAFVKDRLDFGRNPHVYHTVYFTRPELVGALVQWLGLEPTSTAGTPGIRRLSAVPDADLTAGPCASLGMSSQKLGGLAEGATQEGSAAAAYDLTWDFSVRSAPANRGIQDEHPRMRETAQQRSTPTTGEQPPAHEKPVPELTAAPLSRIYFAASMPDSVAVNKTAALLVALSRDVIEAVETEVSRTASVEVNRTRTLIVQIVAKKNLEIMGDDRVELDPGELGHLTDLIFEVKGTNAGVGDVWVLFRQGPVALATLRLAPQVTEDAVQGVRSRIDCIADVAPGPPVAASYPVLQIFERQQGDRLTYQFILEKEDGSYRSRDSQPLKGNREDYVATLYKEIESRWVSSQKDTEAFEREMQAYGGQLLDELIPADIQQDLWDLRDQLRAIHVLSEEPFIPWEIVHLKQPPQPGGNPLPLPKEPQFLAQKGLVRWIHNQAPAARGFRIRKGRSYFVIPNYPHERWKLPSAQAEIPFLEQRLHATQLEAESNAICELLEKPGAIDLFHFSGHGEADTNNIALARIMLLGRVEGSSYIPLYLNSTIVQQWANLKENRPLVILNACQAGRVGWQLTTIGGFAEAFIRAGAGAFVGTLWSVGDGPARTFTESLYRTLLDGGSMAEATRIGREVARAAGEATWLAYVVYGHPLATLCLEETVAADAYPP